MNRLGHRVSSTFSWLIRLFCGVAGIAVLHAATPLPRSPSPKYVLDEAHWLSPDGFQALNGKLSAYERETSSQMVVAIFPAIPEGEELFDFSQRLFVSWKVGQKGKDNGVMFLVFANDRKMRIHTGFGLEGALPDARCKQIIADVVVPLLRKGEKESAINAGVDAMIAATKGEYTAVAKKPQAGVAGKIQDFLFFGIFFLIIGVWIVRVIFGVKRFRSGGYIANDPLNNPGGIGMDVGGWGGGGSDSGGGGGGDSGGGGFSGGGGDSGGGGANGGW